MAAKRSKAKSGTRRKATKSTSKSAKKKAPAKKKSAKKKSSPKKSGVKYCTATTRAGKYRQLYEGKCDKIKGSKMTARDLMKNKSGKIVSRKRSRHGSKQMKKNKHMMAAPYR